MIEMMRQGHDERDYLFKVTLLLDMTILALPPVVEKVFRKHRRGCNYEIRDEKLAFEVSRAEKRKNHFIQLQPSRVVIIVV